MPIFDDLRSALRLVSAHPLFSVTVAAILAVAIGANTAVFSLVDATLLSPLPFPDAAQLVTVDQARGASPAPLSLPDYRDLRDGNRSFEQLAAGFQWSANLTGGEAERIQGMKASASLFAMLRRGPALGRMLLPEDERGSGSAVVVLTHGLRSAVSAPTRRSSAGQILLNGGAYLVVGVLPPTSSRRCANAELIAPFPLDADPRRTARDQEFLRVVGRLRPGVTLAQARADLDAIMARLRAEHPDTNATHTGTVVTEWRKAMVAKQASLLLLLQGAVILVLLVACANVANLYLAQSVRREHEFAIRAALGASAGRRLRQVRFETAVVSAAAAAGGLGLQSLTMRSLLLLAPGDLLRLSPPDASNPRIEVFTLSLTLAVTFVFGTLPALRFATSAPLAGAVRSARGASASSSRVRAVLVGVEVAIASALIIVAVLLSQSFARLQAVDAGIRVDHLLTVRLSLPRAKYRRDGADRAVRRCPAPATAGDPRRDRRGGGQRHTAQRISCDQRRLARRPSGPACRQARRGAVSNDQSRAIRGPLAYRCLQDDRSTITTPPRALA